MGANTPVDGGGDACADPDGSGGPDFLLGNHKAITISARVPRKKTQSYLANFYVGGIIILISLSLTPSDKTDP